MTIRLPPIMIKRDPGILHATHRLMLKVGILESYA